MRWLFGRLALICASLLVLSVLASGPSTAAVVGLVAIALTAVIAVEYAAAQLRARELGVGGRAREHRQVLSAVPAPSHPDTAGRTRSRAPSRLIPAA